MSPAGPPPVVLDPVAVRRARLRAHGLDERRASLADAGATWSVQDSPPGASLGALHARVAGLRSGDLDRALLEDRDLVLAYDPRSATLLLPAAEVGAFGAAHEPPDDDALARMLATAMRKTERPAAEVANRATAAVEDTLADGPLSRDALHQGLRERLPVDLLPWCAPCGSHHARRPLLVVAVVRGRMVHAGREGRQPRFARPEDHLGAPPERPPVAEAVARLVRGHLARSGPSRPTDLAGEHGLSPAHARWAWDHVADELVPVRIGDGPRRWALRDQLDELREPPAVTGVRLLQPGDPALRARDRDMLVPEAEDRAALYRATGAAGALLVDGELLGTWRGRSRRGRLEVELAGRPVPARLRPAVEEEVAGLAALRGLRAGSVVGG